MSINPEARRLARTWYLDPTSQDSATAELTCPVRDMPAETKHRLLRETKPEYYGRSAEIIEKTISLSLANREFRGELGFHWLDSKYNTRRPGNVVSSEITNLEDLGEAFYQTLLGDMNAAIADIRTLECEASFDYEQFERYVSLQALDRYRSALSHHGFGKIETGVAAGLYTATTHITKLIDRMLQQSDVDSVDMHQVIAASYKPIMDIANCDATQLDYFDKTYLSPGQTTPLFTRSRRGTFIFLPDVLTDIQNSPVGVGPTVGCPVLLIQGATKELWQWGVTAANTCGLLKPGLCQ